MGVDCKICVDNEYTDLDRWYVFSDKIRSSTVIKKGKALKLLRSLKKRAKRFNDDHDIKYATHWIMTAKHAIKKGAKNCTIVFYTDHDTPDEYYWHT